ncbi:MAG: enoyl-CoA hydratase/isomerase family protein [Pseudonocardia sp.]|nr:enoyl-CoA hydratase/isomerase family protein [Pseudonocardia sp.]
MSAAATVTSDRADGVTVLRMRAGENRFNPDTLDALDAALDAVEAGPPMPVVLTGEGKFFSNGFDVEWMAGAADGQAGHVVARFSGLAARLLAFPGYVVGAVNGHAFGAGAMLALACDQRVMRDDRGYFCLPEVDLGLSFTPGMAALITTKLAPASAQEAMLTGRRYGGPASVAAGIAGESVSEDKLVDTALRHAAAMVAKPATSVAAIKAAMYAQTIELLRAEAPR